MTKLYTEFAELYHLMYQGLIDYAEEYNYYQTLLTQHHCQSVLEIGCGTGQLGKRFLEAGFDYQGLDISAEMLAFARENVPEDLLHQQDMRNIQLPDRFNAAIITARSTAYLLHNEDLIQAFQSLAVC